MNRRRGKWGEAVASVLICVCSIAPLAWMLRVSLISKESLYRFPASPLSDEVTAENYRALLGFDPDEMLIANNFSSAFANSLVTCMFATAAVMVVAALSGYVFARKENAATNALFAVMLVTMVLPAYSVMLPLYRIMMALGLLDTIRGIVLIYVSAFMPLAIWIMRNSFRSIPADLEEQARIDGAGPFRAMLTMLPVVAPGAVAAAAITFLSAWGQYAIPLVFAPFEAQPITVFLTTVSGKLGVNFGLIGAGGMLALLPPAVVALALNRYLVTGLTKGAVK